MENRQPSAGGGPAPGQCPAKVQINIILQIPDYTVIHRSQLPFP